jgi:hypothetical protein
LSSFFVFASICVLTDSHVSAGAGFASADFASAFTSVFLTGGGAACSACAASGVASIAPDITTVRKMRLAS